MPAHASARSPHGAAGRQAVRLDRAQADGRRRADRVDGVGDRRLLTVRGTPSVGRPWPRSARDAGIRRTVVIRGRRRVSSLTPGARSSRRVIAHEQAADRLVDRLAAGGRRAPRRGRARRGRAARRPGRPTAPRRVEVTSSRSSRTRHSYGPRSTNSPRSRICPMDRSELHAGPAILVAEPAVGGAVEAQRVGEGVAARRLRPVGGLRRERHGVPDPALGLAEPVVIDDQRPIRGPPVRIGEDILDQVAAARDHVVQPEVGRAGEPPPLPEERHDLGLEVADQPGVRLLSSRARWNSIPYFSVKPSIWPWPIIGSPGSVASRVAAPKYLSPVPNCSIAVSSSGFVRKLTYRPRIAGSNSTRVADDLAVARVVLVPDHVHERAVVDPVHPEGSDEVALQQPERLGEEQRVGRLDGDPVDDLAPELVRHAARRTGASASCRCSARDGIPPPLPGSGYQSRSTCFLARTIAASKRITGKRRATSRIVWITVSRTSALRKSSWAVSFHGKLVPSLPW